MPVKEIEKLSISQQAKAQVRAELVADAVEVLKELYVQEHDAEVVLENIRRDIADKEKEIDQGNI